ncbi:MAG: glucose PTS transporter subunit IIA, partial [Centipeda sp. (in: firmicutes)]
MQDIRLDSPLKGRLIPLSEVTDPAFASGAMGRGAAIAEPEGRVVSPVDGEVTVLFGSKHAIGIHSADGVDLLIHVGVDTVKLEGKHFTAHVAQGDTVKRGQLLLEFDPEAIRAEGYETTTPVLVTNAADYGKITFALGDAEISSGGDEPVEEGPAAALSAEDDIDPNLPKEERVAKLIWKYVGGTGNVRSAEHCATRLRLIVNDKSIIDEKAIENIDGVKGVGIVKLEPV